MATVALRAITDTETELLRAALDLGAAAFGGPLSESEVRVAEMARGAPETPERELAHVREEIANGRDPLGEWLCRVRPASERRSMGAFYTPASIVEPMLDWVLAQGVARVVDAGCGSARFAAGVVRRQLSTAVVAVDVDPVATLLARATLATLGARSATVVQADFTDPRAFRLPEIAARTAFVGNPPYVRHHDLTPAAKARAEAMAQRAGHSFSGLAGLHVHFYLATALYARAGDVGCFVTSSEWLDVGYGSVVRALLVNGLGGQSLSVVDPRAVPFDDAMATAAIACFQAGDVPTGMRVRLVHSAGELRDLTLGREIPRDELARAHRWTPFLADRRPSLSSERTVPLGSLVRVSRGVATGSNAYFVLTRERARSLGVEAWCRPAITTAREVLESGGEVRDQPSRRLILDLPTDVHVKSHPDLETYLHLGEVAAYGKPAVKDGYLAQHRRPWWRLGPIAKPPVVVSYMARQAPVFALNPDGLALINIAHGIYPRRPMSEEQLRALVEYLNGARHSFQGMGRTYHGGLEKFEPRELEALRIPSDGPWS